MVTMAKCPVCGKNAPARAVNRAYPFCSERCKLVDLGKWLGEEYRVTGEPDEHAAEAAAAATIDTEGESR